MKWVICSVIVILLSLPALAFTFDGCNGSIVIDSSETLKSEKSEFDCYLLENEIDFGVAGYVFRNEDLLGQFPNDDFEIVFRVENGVLGDIDPLKSWNSIHLVCNKEYVDKIASESTSPLLFDLAREFLISCDMSALKVSSVPQVAFFKTGSSTVNSVLEMWAGADWTYDSGRDMIEDASNLLFITHRLVWNSIVEFVGVFI